MSKNLTLILTVILTAIVSFNAGYFSNSSKKDITNKQDELGVVFKDVQNAFNVDVERQNNLKISYEALQAMETLTDKQLESIDIMMIEFDSLNQPISLKNVALLQIKYAYAVLQEIQ